ncbi:MAG: helix-turn-helix domain-containing protein [Rikenellaceae bacterium]
MRNRQYEKLPLEVICRAMKGEDSAIGMVRTHYRPYLRAMAMEELYDATGGTHYVVNEEIFELLEDKMMDSISKFTLD